MDINLDDPGVKTLLGDTQPKLASGKRHLAQVAGDADHGVTTKHNLDVAKTEVLVYYRAMDCWLTVDVYALPGEPVHIHLICPKCHHALRVQQKEKHIEVDLKAQSPLMRTILASPPADWTPDDLVYLRAKGEWGDLSVEPFQCTWEIDRGQLCRWKAAIDRNIVKEA